MEPTADRPVAEVVSVELDGVQLMVLSVPTEGDLSMLTPSEREVVRLVLAGYSNREISEHRGASVKTIANQLRAVYRKLGVCSRFELAAQLA